MSKREDEKNHEENISKLEVSKQDQLSNTSEQCDAVQKLTVEPRRIRPEPRKKGFSKCQPKEIDEELESQEEEVWGGDLNRKKPAGKNRLKPDKVVFEKLEERPSEDEVQENQWGASSGESSEGGSFRFFLIGGVLVFVLLVGLVGMRLLSGGELEKAEVMRGSSEGASSQAVEENPEKWIRDHFGEMNTESLHILKEYTAAKDKLSRSQWVRNPERYLKLVDDWPVKVSIRMSGDDLYKWDVGHTNGKAYLILIGKDRDYMPLRVYFTREGGDLKLDWEATTAWSEVSLEALRNAGQKRSRFMQGDQVSEASSPKESDVPEAVYSDSVFVRCLIRKKEEYYGGVYTEDKYSAFMLLSANKMHSVWAYAPKDSELDLELRRMLRYGYFVEALKKDICVTVRIRVNRKDALPSQVELVKLEYPEWVSPSDDGGEN